MNLSKPFGEQLLEAKNHVERKELYGQMVVYVNGLLACGLGLSEPDIMDDTYDDVVSHMAQTATLMHKLCRDLAVKCLEMIDEAYHKVEGGEFEDELAETRQMIADTLAMYPTFEDHED